MKNRTLPLVDTAVMRALRTDAADIREQMRPLVAKMERLAAAGPDRYWATSALNHFRCFDYAVRRATLDAVPERMPKSDFFSDEEFDAAVAEPEIESSFI